jgi:hypothetical protein
LTEAHAFLSALFDNRDDKRESWVQIWHKVDKTNAYFKSAAPAADRAVQLRDDVYVCAGLSAKRFGKNQRATREQIIGIPGVWFDVDVVGGPENKQNVAPDVEAAAEFARAVLEPTLIVNSGYGLQAWWLFEDPWLFATKDEQQRAAELVAGWQMTLHTLARDRDWKFDSTHDLARLMRVPGTFNRKGGQEAPVTGHDELITEQDGPRYALETLAEHASNVTMSGLTLHTSTRDVSVNVEFEANPPAEKLEALLENSDAFKRTWNKSRNDDTAKQWSQSEWDLSCASQAVYYGWEDQEVTNLLIAFRRKHGEDLKNPQYYEKTIARAHKRRDLDNERESRQQERAEALDELEQIGQNGNGTADPDHVCAIFSKAVQGPKIKELVQSNRDPKNAVLRLVLADGDEVHIGTMANLLNPDRFREAFATVTGHAMPVIKRPDWIIACNTLLKARVLRDVEITTSHSETRAFLRSYMALLTPDHNEAATRRDPFEKDGEIWIAPRSFADYVNRHLRRRVSVADLEESLSALGFEPKLKTYRDVERDVRTSTKDYYCAPKSVLGQEDDDGAHDA